MAISNENYSLRLNSFEKNVRTCWQELQMENYFCDVTLACDDRQFKTHKTVISSFSPVLKNILKMNKNPNVLIYLRRVNHKDLQNLLTFMYQGVVDVSEQDLPRFLEIAEDLNIRGLSEANLDSFNSEEENTSQINHDAQYPTREKYTEIIDDSTSVGTFTELIGESNENLVNNDKGNLIAPIRSVGEECNEKQNILDRIGNSFICGNCDKQFLTRSGLQKHNQSVHMGVEYTCNKCSFKAKQKSDLKRHVTAVHEGFRYSCELCDHKASFPFALKQHKLAIHEGARHPCDQCHYKATTKPSLKEHVLRIHEGKLYPCGQCGYKAKYKSSLRHHHLKYHN